MSGRAARVRPEGGQPSGRPWDAEDWRQCFDERVAVAGICGGQAEAAARAVAWRSCLARWLDLHPASSDPTRCQHCGRADKPGNLVPFGVGPHAWLHSECWRGWHSARMAEAAQALRAIVSGR